jgi:predicted nucleic-acid-binding protein
VKALDTNVVLRLLLGDDPVQSVLAEAIVQDRCWIGLTVLIEVAWVLGSRYRLSRAETAQVLRSLAAYGSVQLEARAAALWAIDRYDEGGDIADLLHVAAARDAEAFVTFDQAIERSAGPDTPVAIETLR